jgi:AcrR family transcriptional regulator
MLTKPGSGLTVAVDRLLDMATSKGGTYLVRIFCVMRKICYRRAMPMPPTPATTAGTRRERQREETRRDLAVAALGMAGEHGLGAVRVPEIAAAAGVSTRTFNNYFPSKEAAMVWPARRRSERLVSELSARPADEPLTDALIAAVTALYGRPAEHGLPDDWLSTFRRLVAEEPGLHGEYLKAQTAGESALAEAIGERISSHDTLEARVLAATVLGAERAAILDWMARSERPGRLLDHVLAALDLALAGVGG